MRIGIISDIHGNILALESVLNEFKNQNVDKIICTGDIIGIGPYPDEAVKCVMKQNNIISCVRGNHEGYLLNGVPTVIHDDKRSLLKEECTHHKWTHSQISNESRKFIETLPVDDLIEIEGKKIYVVHYPLDRDKNYAEHIKHPVSNEMKDLFSYVDADVYIYGHTHVAYIKQIENKLYINCGSLGCPESNDFAKCGILDIVNGKIDFKLLEVKYDVNRVINDIKKIHYPFSDGMLKSFYGQKIK